jgi:hypothetical protein
MANEKKKLTIVNELKKMEILLKKEKVNLKEN